jgi:leucyl aminopeptidase (aminopeptidase T)
MSSAAASEKTRTRVARAVLQNNLKVRPGERVMIEAWTHTLPWAVTLARETRRLGAFPLVPYEDEEAFWDVVDHGGAKVLGRPAAHEWAALASTDVYIHMWGPGDRVRLGGLPPAKAGQIFSFNDDWYKTAAKAGVRGARLEVGRPFPSLARAYGIGLDRWTEQVVRGTLVPPDRLAQAAAPIVRALARGRRLTIRDDEGTDLTLGLAGRTPRAYTGTPITGDRNRRGDLLATLPAGSIRVAIDESVAEGTMVANRTCYYEDGTATGAVFRFRDGRLTDAQFESGGERFESGFRAGGKGRDRPGFLGIGLNPELEDTPQLEDVEQGVVMVTLGGNANLGGRNTSRFFGWAIRSGATVEVDGRPLPLGR